MVTVRIRTSLDSTTDPARLAREEAARWSIFGWILTQQHSTDHVDTLVQLRTRAAAFALRGAVDRTGSDAVRADAGAVSALVGDGQTVLDLAPEPASPPSTGGVG